jgi:hypothetical protein
MAVPKNTELQVLQYPQIIQTYLLRLLIQSIHLCNFRILKLNQELQLTDSITVPKLDTSSYFVKLAISKCGGYLATGSKDSNVYVLELPRKTSTIPKAMQLIGHRAGI